LNGVRIDVGIDISRLAGERELVLDIDQPERGGGIEAAELARARYDFVPVRRNETVIDRSGKNGVNHG
jgi:hypothetical protein